jgi:type VI protein secretion system component VasK
MKKFLIKNWLRAGIFLVVSFIIFLVVLPIVAIVAFATGHIITGVIAIIAALVIIGVYIFIFFNAKRVAQSKLEDFLARKARTYLDKFLKA